MNHPSFNTTISIKENLLFLLGFYNQRAIYHLERKTNFHENIHQARLCCKRQRSVLRLFRHALGESQYRALNEFYRENSRKLSPLRDLTAQMETCDLLLSHTKKDNAARYLRKTISNFNRERNTILHSNNFGKVRSDVIAELHQMGEKLGQIDLSNEDGEKILAKGVAAMICRAQKEFQINANSIDPHSMHQWRKRVKYLWYHLYILTPLWPSILGAFAMELQILSKLLGKHHDLFILEEYFKQSKSKSGNQEEVSFVLRKIYRERVNLETKSLQLGALIFGIINCKDFGIWFGRLYSSQNNQKQ